MSAYPVTATGTATARSSTAVDPAALEIRYEPIMALATGRVVGAEALLRRRLPGGVLQIAARFLPDAASRGLMVEIGRRVLDEACGHAADWQRQRRGVVVAVNLSSDQLADATLPAWVEAVLTRHALRPELLLVDVPESVVARAASDGGRRLQNLRDIAGLGVRVAVDDVGTGAPAPTYLSTVPASVLKIEGRFVRGLSGPGDGRLVEAIIGLARDRGLLSLAEGIEQPEQAAALRALGCELAQGYAIGRATSAEDIAERLRD